MLTHGCAQLEITITYRENRLCCTTRCDMSRLVPALRRRELLQPDVRFGATASPARTHTDGSRDVLPTRRASALRKLIFVMAGFVLIVVPSAAADSSYRDVANDSSAAIDISSVRVSDDAAGRIRFSVDILDAAEQPEDAVFLLFLNVDRNRLTGDPGAFGAEYAFQLDGAQRTALFARWNGMSYDTIPGSSSSFEAGYDEGPRVEVDRREIGGDATRGIDFWMRAVQGGGGEGRVDDAPDDGTWTYELTGGLPDVSLPLRLQATAVTAAPRKPVGGRRFTITMAVRRSDGGSVLGLMECTARLGRKPVATSSTLWRDRVRCALVVPAGSARRLLTMRISIRSETAVLVRTLRFRVGD